MGLLVLILVVCGTFAVCFLADKGFARLFRSKPQHASGRSVRLSKRYPAFGAVLVALGAACLLTGVFNSWLLAVCGVIMIALGIAMAVYYMTFGVFYDEDGFLLTTFGHKSTVYRYSDIEAQRLYNAYGSVLIELYLTGGRSVQLQGGMEGVYPFLDHAFSRWLCQTGRQEADCPFYDPANSCWFPPVEG